MPSIEDNCEQVMKKCDGKRLTVNTKSSMMSVTKRQGSGKRSTHNAMYKLRMKQMKLLVSRINGLVRLSHMNFHLSFCSWARPGILARASRSPDFLARRRRMTGA